MEAIPATGSVLGELVGAPSAELRLKMADSEVRLYTLFQSMQRSLAGLNEPAPSIAAFASLRSLPSGCVPPSTAAARPRQPWGARETASGQFHLLNEPPSADSTSHLKICPAASEYPKHSPAAQPSCIGYAS
jgi:hypothetical protein